MRTMLLIAPANQTDSKRRHKSKLHELEEEVRMQMSHHKRTERFPSLRVTLPTRALPSFKLHGCTSYPTAS